MAKTFDLRKTDAVVRLLARPREQRDAGWRDSLFDVVVDASLASTPEKLMTGPDGFRYFVLMKPRPGKEFTPFTVGNVLEECTNRGLGIVIEPGSRGPEYLFRYGDLFSLRAYETFKGDPEDRRNPTSSAPSELPAGSRILTGAPSEEMMPKWASRVVAEYLRTAANVKEPKVLAMVQQGPPLTRDLVFNIHPEDFLDAAFDKLMTDINWFMPPGRSVTALPRSSSLMASAVPLDP